MNKIWRPATSGCRPSASSTARRGCPARAATARCRRRRTAPSSRPVVSTSGCAAGPRRHGAHHARGDAQRHAVRHAAHDRGAARERPAGRRLGAHASGPAPVPNKYFFGMFCKFISYLININII